MVCGIVRQADAQIVVHGRITAAESGEVLIGAGVFDTLSDRGATTNNYGLYSIAFSPGKKVLIFSYPGYAEVQLDTNLTSSANLNIALKTIPQMDQVVIKSKPRNTSGNTVQMSMLDIPVQQIKKMPALLGEVDVVKALQLLPGVKGGNEGSSGLYVRGGGPDQNLILLDGVPLYNIQHMFGFFSVFNADAINSIQL